MREAHMETFEILSLDSLEPQQIRHFLEERWGNHLVVSRGKLHDAAALPGFWASQQGQMIGLVTYDITADSCELVTLDSVVEGIGVGSALIAAVKDAARAANCQRLWLITTNDNLPALGFYQKRGFRLTAVHRNALAESRKLKPQIPLIGLDGIPLRDEIELEMPLKS
jgi:ribosomal protein S18 acetylase RimI-like enzyme